MKCGVSSDPAQSTTRWDRPDVTGEHRSRHPTRATPRPVAMPSPAPTVQGQYIPPQQLTIEVGTTDHVVVMYHLLLTLHP